MSEPNDTNHPTSGASEGALDPSSLRPRKFSARRFIYRYGLLLVLACLLVFFALTQQYFFTAANLLIILQSVTIVTVVALGVTVSLAANGFDLSVGANVGFVLMGTTTVMIRFQFGGPSAIAVGLLAGAVIGILNGLLIVKAKVPDLLATLGSMFVWDGLALIMTHGESVSPGMSINAGGGVAPGVIAKSFFWLGRGKVFGVPSSVIIMIVIVAAVVLFLERTRWGRMIYAIGGNQQASRLAGIRVERIRILAYIVSGVLASIGGIILAARLGRGDVGAGDPFLLESVAAALIGYAVLGANKANAVGTFVGAVFVGLLLNGLTMMNFPYYTQDFVEGVLLVAALVMSFSSIFRTGGTG